MNFTPEQLAKRWSVTANTIRAMCKRNELEHFRPGKLYRIPRKAVEDYENQCTTGSSNTVESGQSLGQSPDQRAEFRLARMTEKQQSA